MKNFKFNLSTIISLWQNPYYSNILLNFYNIINRYLNGGGIIISEKILDELNLIKEEFEEFTIKYINSLTNILYKNPKDSIILYRGETRSDIDIKLHDILLYKNFHSTTDSISFGFKFSLQQNSKSDIKKNKLLLVLKIPKGFHYIKLNKPIVYNNNNNITEFYNEYEYLIPPNCYYQVTNIYKLSDNIILIKAILIKQEKYIIPSSDPNLIYTPNQPSIKKNLKDFTNDAISNFIVQFKYYYHSLELLDKLKDYHISHILFQMLSSSLYSNFFNLNIGIILDYANKINDNNFLNIMYTLDQFGFHYKKKDLVKPEIYINTLKKLASSNILSLNYIYNMKVFYSANNFNFNMEKPKFIKLLDENSDGKYKYILECSTIPDCSYYDCVSNNIYPNLTLEKNNKKTLIYTKYIVEFNLSNVKIAISNLSKQMFINKILLIPNFTYKVKSKVKSKNKFGKNIIIYQVDLYN